MKFKKSKDAGKKKLGDISSRYILATGLMQQGNLTEAEFELEKIVQSKPDHAAAINLLSIVYAQLGKFDKALTLNTKLLENNRTNQDYCYNRGIILYSSGKKNDAIEAFELTINCQNDHIGSYLYLGLIYFENDDFNHSLACYKKAIELNPYIYEAWFNCGRIYSALKMSTEAIDSFEHAIQITSNTCEVFYYLGNEFLLKERLDDALKAYNKTIEIDPMSQMAFYNIGNILLRKMDIDGAINAYNMCLSINPDNDMALLNIGNAYLEKNYIDKALYSYGKCLEIDSIRKSYNCLMIGKAMQINGMYGDAIIALNACIALDPVNVIAYFNLGNALYKTGKIKDARIAFENAIKIDQSHLDSYTDYALMEYVDGDKDNALKLFRKIIELDPGNVQAKHMINALEGITPETAPPGEYIAAIFDQYSSDFEQHLKKLAYNAPTLLREELELINKDKKKFTNTIDLGCGTGLSGIDFREITCRLSGIDLSEKMINEAKKKNIYDQLTVGSISSLNAITDRFDLIIATDLFIYIGNLDEVFDTVLKIASNGAYFLFSVESIDGNSFVLQPSGRFAHSSAYIEGLASDKGFSVLRRKSVPLRKGGTGWIDGEICILQKEVSHSIKSH